jgi:hypothetical protein
MMNAAGQLLFQNVLSGTTGSVWSWDPAIGLQCVVRSGDSIEVQPGVFKLVSTPGSVSFSNGDGRPLGFANDGTATFRIPLLGGSKAVANVTVGSLAGFPARISAAAGGTHNLHLNAGAALAGHVYVVAGSMTGTTPGTPVGAFTVPLNVDAYTENILQHANMAPFVNTVGVLNGDGRALAQIVIPPAPFLAGLSAHHAFAVVNGGGYLVFASRAVPILILP